MADWLHRQPYEDNFANTRRNSANCVRLLNSKVLLTAVTFDLFTVLGQGRFTGPEIGEKLDLHPRGVADFLDALVAMKVLEREGDGANAKYFNTPATALYLDRNSPRSIGGIPEMLNALLLK